MTDDALALGLLLTVLLLHAVDGRTVMSADGHAWLYERGHDTTPRRVTDDLAALQQAGLVDVDAPPYYRLTPAGCTVLRPAADTIGATA